MPIKLKIYKRGFMNLVALSLLFISLSGLTAEQGTNYSPSKNNPAESTRSFELKGDLEQIKYGCCRICTVGCACGNSCISCSKNCNKGVGCACNG